MARVTLGGSRTLEDAEAAERAVLEEQIRQARLEFARRCSRWQELENDFVPRDRGRLFVSASSDLVYKPSTGLVFSPHSASPVADHAPLSFVVDEGGELRFYEQLPGTWSDRVARRARLEARRRAPRQPMRRRA